MKSFGIGFSLRLSVDRNHVPHGSFGVALKLVDLPIVHSEFISHLSEIGDGLWVSLEQLLDKLAILVLLDVLGGFLDGLSFRDWACILLDCWRIFLWLDLCFLLISDRNELWNFLLIILKGDRVIL